MRLVCGAASVVLVLVLAGCTADAEPGARPTDAPSSVDGAPSERWRTEVWRDLQLEVPSGWALGYAPMPNATGALQCGVGPLEGSGEESRPYVGRPGHGSDVCVRTGLDELAMTGEGVWFGSPLAEGEVESKNGLEQTTVAVGTSRITVATYDEVVREHVLDSVERVGRDAHGCPVRPAVERGYPDEGYGEVQSLAICVYERGGGWQRLWSSSLPAGPGVRLVEALDSAEPGRPCRAGDHGQLVLLRVTADDPMGDEPLARDLVARPDGCASVQHWGTGGRWLGLEPSLVRPWAVPGVSTYVWSNGLPAPVARFFRSMWG